MFSAFSEVFWHGDGSVESMDPWAGFCLVRTTGKTSHLAKCFRVFPTDGCTTFVTLWELNSFAKSQSADGVQFALEQQVSFEKLNKLNPPKIQSFERKNCRMLLCFLLSGGRFSPSIISRHRKRGPTNCTCSVGGEYTALQASFFFFCSFYHEFRKPILHPFHHIIQASSCFRFAFILTSRDGVLKDHVGQIQTVLIQIWRTQIKQYLNGESFGPSASPPRRQL